jgi:hypothetical protein
VSARRLKVEIGCAADREEELPVHPVFVRDGAKNHAVRDFIGELRAPIGFDVSALFERLPRVAPSARARLPAVP